MITFKQFITEEEAITFRELIERDCKPFLQESKQHGLLYRGVAEGGIPIDTALSIRPGVDSPREHDLIYWEKTVRQDRKPKDSQRQQHQIMDNWFKKKFGFGARSQTMFCLGETGKNLLRQYGVPCAVFPIGEFNYVWSPIVKDLYNEIGQDINKLKDGDEEKLIEFLNSAKYIDSHLHKAVNMKNEVMVQCDRYYAFELAGEHAIKLALDMTP